MVDGIGSEKEAAGKASANWSIDIDELLRFQVEKASRSENTVERVGAQVPPTPPPRTWSSRPAVAPAFMPAEPAAPVVSQPGRLPVATPPATEVPVKPATQQVPAGQMPLRPITPFTPAMPAKQPAAPQEVSPRPGRQVNPGPAAPPFAAPESPDAARSNAVKPSSPFLNPQVPPPRPQDKPPTAPPRGTTSGGNEVTPWNQWIRQNSGINPPGSVLPPGGFPRPNGFPLPGVLPGPGGRQAGGDHPGINPTNQVINITPDARKAIDDALHNAVNVQGNVLGGGVWGAALNTTRWGMDYAYSKGSIQWWEPYCNFMKKLGSEELKVDKAREVHAVAEAVQAQAAEKLGPSVSKIQDLLGAIDKHLVPPAELTAGGAAASAPLSAEALDLLQKQRAFISDVSNLTNLRKVTSVIGTAEQVASGGTVLGTRKLFIQGTPAAEALLERAQLHMEYYKARGGVSGAEARLTRLETDLQAMREAGPGNGFKAAANGFFTGALVTGGTIGAGYLADKYLVGSNANMNGFDRFLIDGVAIPAVILTPGLLPRYKVGAAVALFALARAKGYMDNSGVPALSQSSLLLRPNTIDTLGFTAAAIAPLGVKGKLAIAGGTLVAGRLYNVIARATGLDGPDGIELRDNAVHALTRDSNTKTTTTFDNAVEAGLALARHKAGEGALDLQLADLINAGSQTPRADYLRSHAILSTAVGMARLEKGSRIVEGGSNAVDVYGDDARILKPYRYDFLGESSLELARAFTDLSDLRYVLFQEKAKVNTDKTLSDSARKEKLASLDEQMKQCDTERKKVNNTLKGIFGPFDIDKIFAELTDACRTRGNDMAQIIFKRKQLFETLSQQTAPEFRAKFARDLTLAHLAEANFMTSKNDGEQARIMYLAAMEYLSKARSLDPNNPNLKKIQDIAISINSHIPRAVTNQYNSNWNNPFQIKPPGQK